MSTRCAIVAQGSTGLDAMRAAGHDVRLKGGFVCGIDGLPATGCGVDDAELALLAVLARLAGRAVELLGVGAGGYRLPARCAVEGWSWSDSPAGRTAAPHRCAHPDLRGGGDHGAAHHVASGAGTCVRRQLPGAPPERRGHRPHRHSGPARRAPAAGTSSPQVPARRPPPSRHRRPRLRPVPMRRRPGVRRHGRTRQRREDGDGEEAAAEVLPAVGRVAAVGCPGRCRARRRPRRGRSGPVPGPHRSRGATEASRRPHAGARAPSDPASGKCLIERLFVTTVLFSSDVRCHTSSVRSIHGPEASTQVGAAGRVSPTGAPGHRRTPTKDEQTWQWNERRHSRWPSARSRSSTARARS